MGKKNLVVLSLILILIAVVLVRPDYREVFLTQLSNFFHPHRTYRVDRDYACDFSDINIRIGWLQLFMPYEQWQGECHWLSEKFPEDKVVHALATELALCKISLERREGLGHLGEDSRDIKIEDWECLSEAIDAVKHGKKIDPENAYYDYLDAYLLFAARKDEVAIDAIRKGNAKARYDHYEDELMEANRVFLSKQNLLGFFKRIRTFNYIHVGHQHVDSAKMIAMLAELAEQKGKHEKAAELFTIPFIMAKKIMKSSNSLHFLRLKVDMQRSAYECFQTKEEFPSPERKLRLEADAISRFLAFLEKYADKESIQMVKAELSHPYVATFRRGDPPFHRERPWYGLAGALLCAVIYAPLIGSSMLLTATAILLLFFAICSIIRFRRRSQINTDELDKKPFIFKLLLLTIGFLILTGCISLHLGTDIGFSEEFDRNSRYYLFDRNLIRDWFTTISLTLSCIFALSLLEPKIKGVRNKKHVGLLVDIRGSIFRVIYRARFLPICIFIFLLCYLSLIALHCCSTSVAKHNLDLRLRNEVKALYEGDVKKDPFGIYGSGHYY